MVGQPSIPAGLNKDVAELLQSRNVPGCSVAVAHADEVIWREAFGLARVEDMTPSTAQTIYAIGSLTKQFTAAAIVLLAQKGILTIDDEVSRFLPAKYTPTYRPTIRHFLSHTSGIGPRVDSAMLSGFGDEGGLPKESVLRLLEDPFESAPGFAWRYSSAGYYVLGLVIEAVTGEPLDSHLRRSLLTPLGLNSTYYGKPTAQEACTATGYAVAGGGFAEVQAPPAGDTFSSGALWSTVEELICWERALRD